MARDAIARLYDVDADLVKLTPIPIEGSKKGYQPGTISFAAKKGRSIDLGKIHESITATRLSGGTNMSVDYLDITARGEVSEVDGKLVLKVSGSGQEFELTTHAEAKDVLPRLREAVRGTGVTQVTGRVHGWSGRFPDVLKALAGNAIQKRTVLAVSGFELSKN